MGEYICNSRTKKDKYLEYIQNFKSIKKKRWLNGKTQKTSRCVSPKKRKKERNANIIRIRRGANQKHGETEHTTARRAKMKMMENTNSGENAEQWSHVADGQAN